MKTVGYYFLRVEFETVNTRQYRDVKISRIGVNEFYLNSNYILVDDV